MIFLFILSSNDGKKVSVLPPLSEDIFVEGFSPLEVGISEEEIELLQGLHKAGIVGVVSRFNIFAISNNADFVNCSPLGNKHSYL